jgi:uncharacterized protein (TIGR03067 family)
MRPALLFVAILCLTSSGTATAGEDDKKDLSKMQGTWMHQGEPLVAVIKGDTMKTGEKGKEPVLVAKIKLHASKSPKWIDAEADGGAKWLGIYKFDGDKLIMVLAAEPSKRPTEIPPKKGEDVQYFILTRK